jgi:glycosyltransferase involved in cell wall biosynthesis
MQDPIISVVVPVYNVEKHLPATVESLKRQTLGKNLWEAVFVDDCSADKSMSILKKLTEDQKNMRIITMPRNSGVSSARNRGISEAQAEYIAQLDGDDMYEPPALEVVAKNIAENPDSGYFYSSHKRVDKENKEIRAISARPFDAEKLLHYNFISPVKVFSRTVDSAIGGFRDTYAEDWDHPLRALDVLEPGQFTRIKDSLYRYVMRNGSCIHATTESDKRAMVCKFLKPQIEKRMGGPVEVFWSHNHTFEDGNSFNYYDWSRGVNND